MNYKKLLFGKKLIKYWLFFNGGFNRVFTASYSYLSFSVNSGYFTDIKYLILSMKCLIPFFLTLPKLNSAACFITSNYVYKNMFLKRKEYFNKITYYKRIKRFKRKICFKEEGYFNKVGCFKFFKIDTLCRPGSVSNFAIMSSETFNNPDFGLQLGAVIFTNYQKKDFILLETRNADIPAIALVCGVVNAGFVDYPFFVNSIYFHTVYFFTRLLCKFLF
jgi:hypothetical protein